MTILVEQHAHASRRNPTAARPRSRGLALLVSAALASGLMVATAQPASAATMLGGADIAAYCAARVSSGTLAPSQAVNINNLWNGWRCATRWGLVQLDMNAVCDLNYPTRWFWEPKAFAGHLSTSPLSWRCYR